MICVASWQRQRFVRCSIAVPLRVCAVAVEVYRKYPQQRETGASEYLLDAITIDAAAVDFFERYELADGRHLSTDKQEEYVNNASILNRCREVLEAHADMRGRHGKQLLLGEFWQKAAMAMERLQDLWNCVLAVH